MNSKRVLITGITGLLGKSLVETNTSNEIYGIYATRKQLPKIYNKIFTKNVNIIDKSKLRSLFKSKIPEVVIHTAAASDVDWCENNKDEAYKINVQGTENIINLCREFNSKLIFISSNAVFDGNNSPYQDSSKPLPINYYGTLKSISETEVSNAGIDFAIARPILMYGWNNSTNRKNPVTWQIDLMKQCKDIQIVDDIYCNPLYAPQCADVIWKMVEQNTNGFINIAGKNRLSRYEFALQIADIFGFDKNLIKPVKNNIFKNLAARPVDTTFKTDRMENELKIIPMSTLHGLNYMKEKND